MRQINAALQEAYTNDHIAANKEPPVAKLVDNPEYASAKLIADNAALPDKGERPDRDPQVRGVAHPRHVPYGAAIATDMWVLRQQTMSVSHVRFACCLAFDRLLVGALTQLSAQPSNLASDARRERWTALSPTSSSWC